MSIFNFFNRKKGTTQQSEKGMVFQSQNFSGVCNTPLDSQYTPDRIYTLGKRDIFVFGSNLTGRHGGGAARIAMNRFGAVYGQGEGLQGNSFAIPTMQGGVETIQPYVDRFIEFAKREKTLTFYVTKIGCGIAGFKVSEIAPLFAKAIGTPNIRLPKDFVEFLLDNGVIAENEYQRGITEMSDTKLPLVNSSMSFVGFEEGQSGEDIINSIVDSQDARRKNRIKHLSSPIKVIGAGGGGGNAVLRSLENPKEGIEYGVINSYFSNKHNTEAIEIRLISNDPCSTVSNDDYGLFNSNSVSLRNKAAINELIDDSTKLLIVAVGLGGGTGYIVSKWLVMRAKELNVPVVIVGSLPFVFEGEMKMTRAKDRVLKLSDKGGIVNVVNPETITQEPDVDFFNCFPKLDEIMAEEINKICEVNSNLVSEMNNTVSIDSHYTPDEETTTHVHGMTRTFADIIIALNKEKRYSSPEEAISDLGSYFDRFKLQGDGVAFISIRILMNILCDEKMFGDNGLNIEALRQRIFEPRPFGSECDNAYDNYCREKLANLISYLNEFRRYTSPEEIRIDLFNETDVLRFSHCGPIDKFYYFQMGCGSGMNYPVNFFVRALRDLWTEITTEGILDGDKMRTVMFRNLHKTIKSIGLEATIAQNYVDDGPCHPEVFFPKTMGTGPIYVKKDNGQFTRSCGEGKGPNNIPDWLEFQVALRLLDKDNRYIIIGNYYVPKDDETLPIYGVYQGKLTFDSFDAKKKFIHDAKAGKIRW